MILSIEAVKRITEKKSDLVELRNNGFIPAVIYGEGIEALSIAVKSAEFTKIYKKSIGEMAFYDVNVESKKYHCILKDKQVHPVRRDFLHLDFMAVKAKTHVEVEIPLKFVGEPIGLKSGGLMDILLRNVKISCQANQVPQDIEIDISKLEVGSSLHIGDLPQGIWQYKDNDDIAIIVIHAKKVDTAAEPEPVEEPKETE